MGANSRRGAKGTRKPALAAPVKAPSCEAFGRRLHVAKRAAGAAKQDLIDATATSDGTVAAWLRGASFPKGAELARLAEYLDVSMDWLVGRTGRNDVPQRPNRARSDRVLIRDLTAHWRAAALDVLRTEIPGIEARHVHVDGEELLAEFTAMAAARAVRNFERARRNVATTRAHDIVSNALLQLSDLASDVLSPATQRRLARAMRRVKESERALHSAAILFEEFEPGIGVRSDDGLWPAARERVAPPGTIAGVLVVPPDESERMAPTDAFWEESVRLGDEEHRQRLEEARASGNRVQEMILTGDIEGFLQPPRGNLDEDEDTDPPNATEQPQAPR